MRRAAPAPTAVSWGAGACNRAWGLPRWGGEGHAGAEDRAGGGESRRRQGHQGRRPSGRGKSRHRRGRAGVPPRRAGVPGPGTEWAGEAAPQAGLSHARRAWAERAGDGDWRRGGRRGEGLTAQGEGGTGARARSGWGDVREGARGEREVLGGGAADGQGPQGGGRQWRSNRRAHGARGGGGGEAGPLRPAGARGGGGLG
jgi:hypothetical protein